MGWEISLCEGVRAYMLRIVHRQFFQVASYGLMVSTLRMTHTYTYAGEVYL